MYTMQRTKECVILERFKSRVRESTLYLSAEAKVGRRRLSLDSIFGTPFAIIRHFRLGRVISTAAWTRSAAWTGPKKDCAADAQQRILPRLSTEHVMYAIQLF